MRELLGRILWRLGAKSRAERLYGDILCRHPRQYSTRRRLTDLLLDGHRYEEALPHCQYLAEHWPEPASHWGRLGYALQMLGRHDEAITALRMALDRDPNNSSVYFNLAENYDAKRLYQEALVAYRHTVRLDPHNAEAVGNLGAILGQLGHWEDAAEFHRRAYALRPDPCFLYNLGVALDQLDDLKGAEHVFRDLLKDNPEYADARIRLARVLIDRERYEDALALIRSGGRPQEDPVLLGTLVEALDRTGRLDEALAVGLEATRQFPEHGDVHSALGWVLLRLRRCEEALGQFEEAQRLAPGALEFRVGLGAVLSTLERHDEAIEVFKSVLQHEPDFFERYRDVVRYWDESRKATTKE